MYLDDKRTEQNTKRTSMTGELFSPPKKPKKKKTKTKTKTKKNPNKQTKFEYYCYTTRTSMAKELRYPKTGY
jgi:hypothetical protein